MTKSESKKLTALLLAEYQKSGVRKLYKGLRSPIIGSEGFAWRSQLMGKWCFIPLRTEFNVDNIILVDGKNLHNL